MGFKFEKLEVWQKALDLSEQIHELTKGFPLRERSILTGQIQRAADSIVLNIAEGSTGQTNAEFKQFLSYAQRSAMEVVACLYLARKRKLLSDNLFQTLYDNTEKIARMIQALRRSLI